MELQIVYYVIAGVLILVGLAGVVLPVLPGLPLMFAGMLLAAWADDFQRGRVIDEDAGFARTSQSDNGLGDLAGVDRTVLRQLAAQHQIAQWRQGLSQGFARTTIAACAQKQAGTQQVDALESKRFDSVF